MIKNVYKILTLWVYAKLGHFRNRQKIFLFTEIIFLIQLMLNLK